MENNSVDTTAWYYYSLSTSFYRNEIVQFLLFFMNWKKIEENAVIVSPTNLRQNDLEEVPRVSAVHYFLGLCCKACTSRYFDRLD